MGPSFAQGEWGSDPPNTTTNCVKNSAAPHIVFPNDSKQFRHNMQGVRFFLVASLLSLSACNESGGLPAFVNPNSPAGSGTNNSSLFSNLQHQPGAQKLIYHVGPKSLSSGESAEVNLEQPAELKFQVSEPVWVTGFKPQVIDQNGNPLPGHLLYKAIVFNKGEPNPACATGNGGNPFAVATSALTPVQLPEGFGYPLLPDDPLEAKVIFQNPTDEEYVGVMFAFELETVPMDQANGFGDVQAILLDTDPCGHKPLALQPGEFAEKNQTFTLPQGGHLMVANGVLSNYGVAVSLTHQKSGDISVLPFWRAEAQLNENHQIVDLTPNPFLDPEGKKIQNGDRMTLGVTFDNFSNTWNNEATGGAMIYLAPENPS